MAFPTKTISSLSLPLGNDDFKTQDHDTKPHPRFFSSWLSDPGQVPSTLSGSRVSSSVKGEVDSSISIPVHHANIFLHSFSHTTVPGACQYSLTSHPTQLLSAPSQASSDPLLTPSQQPKRLVCQEALFFPTDPEDKKSKTATSLPSGAQRSWPTLNQFIMLHIF